MAMQTGRKLGMQELGAALLELVRQGLVTPEEALSKAVEREPLAKELVRHGLMTPLAGPTHSSTTGVAEKIQPAPEVDEARNRAIAAAARGLPSTRKKAWFS